MVVLHIEFPGVRVQIVLIDSWFGRIAVVCSSVLTVSGPASLVKPLKHQAAKLSHGCMMLF